MNPAFGAEPATVEGTLEVYYRCDFDHGHSELIHEVISDRDGRRYRLRSKTPLAEGYRTGDRVLVQGTTEGNEIRLTADLSGLVHLEQADVSAALLARQKTLVICVAFQDWPFGCTRSSISNLMFSTTSTSVDASYRASSYDELGFEGIVVGPYTIAANMSPCDDDLWRDLARTAAEADGHNYADYDRIAYFGSFSACGWGGLGTVGGNPGWAMSAYCYEGTAMAHELGHNLGMHHASTDFNNDGTIDSEYGDYSCIMGSPYQWRQLNAPHSYQLNWIHPEKRTHNPGNGTYHLAPLEVDPSSTSYDHLVTIPISTSSEMYFLSYRREIGIEELLLGYEDRLSIHRYSSGSAKTRLVAKLLDTQTFTDSAEGLTIQQTSHDDDKTTITITRTAPSLVVALPADVTIQCNEDLSPANTGMAAGIDSCEGEPTMSYTDSTVAGSCAYGSVITRTWTATNTCDESDIANQIITVTDSTLPVLSLPADVADVACDADISPAAMGTATATDYCDPTPVVTSSDQHSGTNRLVRTWQATDVCGNVATADQVLEGPHFELPVLTLPADVTIECGSDISPAVAGQATATYVCELPPVVTYADELDGLLNTSGLELHYRLDETSGAAADSSGNGRDGALASTPTQGVAGKVDTSYDFGPGGRVTATGYTGISGTRARTVTAWIRVGSTATADYRFVHWGKNQKSRMWELVLAGSKYGGRLAVCIYSGWIAWGNDLRDGQWHHVAVVYSGGALNRAKAYIDGVLTPRHAGSSDGRTPNIILNDDVRVGNINGRLDDVAIWSRALSAAEIATLMTAGTRGCGISDLAGVGDVTRTWTGTSAAGYASSGIQHIVRPDTAAPVITCPADITLSAGDDTSPASTGQATATDTCHANPKVTYSDVINGSCPEVITRTWVATDVGGNTTACDQFITLPDNVPPVLTCAADTTVECGADPDPATTGQTTATDNCDPAPTVTYEDWVGADPSGIQGLHTWLKADAGVILTSGLVTRWEDQSGNGNHVFSTTTANQAPDDIASSTGGQPTIRFDGVNDRLYAAASYNLVKPYTILTVAKYNAGTHGRVFSSYSRNWVMGFLTDREDPCTPTAGSITDRAALPTTPNSTH